MNEILNLTYQLEELLRCNEWEKAYYVAEKLATATQKMRNVCYGNMKDRNK